MKSIDWKMIKNNWDILAIAIGYPLILLITGGKFLSSNIFALFGVIIVALILVILRILSFRYMSFYTHEWKRKFGRGKAFMALAGALLLATILSSVTIPAGFLREALTVTLLYIAVILFYSDKRQHFTAIRGAVNTFKPRNPRDLN